MTTREASVLDDLDPAVAIAIWGYDLRGPGALEVTALIAEGGDDRNVRPLWDHPEWLEGWYRDGEPCALPAHRALPYAPGNPWAVRLRTYDRAEGSHD